LTSLLASHIAPELLYLESKWASLVSYSMTVDLLRGVLPIDTRLRNLAAEMAPYAEHHLDWLHIAMRLMVLGQYAKGLIHHDQEAGDRIARNLLRISGTSGMAIPAPARCGARTWRMTSMGSKKTAAIPT